MDILGDTQVTETDQIRLAQIRAKNIKWLAIDPNWAASFDTTFLLCVIDELNEKLRGAK